MYRSQFLWLFILLMWTVKSVLCQFKKMLMLWIIICVRLIIIFCQKLSFYRTKKVYIYNSVHNNPKWPSWDSQSVGIIGIYMPMVGIKCSELNYCLLFIGLYMTSILPASKCVIIFRKTFMLLSLLNHCTAFYSMEVYYV